MQFRPILRITIFILLVLGLGACSKEAEPPKLQQAQDTPVTLTEVLVDEQIFSHLSDLDTRLKAFSSASSVEEQAKILAEVDSWLFTEGEELAARARIEEKVEKLRKAIAQRIATLRKQALQARTGKSATDTMRQVGNLLSLYSAPSTDAQNAALAKLSDEILETSYRIEEIRRLRFNKWALDQITEALDKYYGMIKVRTVSDLKKRVLTNANNKADLIKQCAPIIAKINPDGLEPMTRNLYDHALNLLQEAMNDDTKLLKSLGSHFTNPALTRKSPQDF